MRTSAGIDVGRTLRRERTRRRITLSQAVEDTKILRRYLEALESNHDASAYPAPVYARAFLREYASYLDLDPAPLLVVFHAGDDGPEDLEALLPPAPPRRIVVPAWGVLVAALVVLVAGLAVVGDRLPNGAVGRVDAPTIPPSAPAAASSQPETGASVLAERTTAPAGTLTVAVAVLGEPCWLQVTADGVQRFAATLQPGEQRTFTALHDIVLVIGNAGALRITVNGTELAASGRSGEVRTVRVSLAGGAVRVTATPAAAA